MQIQGASFSPAQVELSGRSVAVKGGGFGERGRRVPGQRVGCGAGRVGVAQRSGPEGLGVLGLIGVACGSQRQWGLSGESQGTVSLDGKLRRVTAELLVMLDNVSV